MSDGSIFLLVGCSWQSGHRKRMFSLRRISSVALAMFAFCTVDAAAEPACEKSLSPNNPVVTKDAIGTPLAKEYFKNARGIWMKVPYGYFDPWPNRKLKEAVPGTPEAAELPVGTSMVFAFWMPTLRWPERNPMSVPSFRSCEDGRRMPQDGEYMVRAELLWPWLPDRVTGGHKTPNEQFSSSLKYLGIKPVSREYDLLRLEQATPDGLIVYHETRPSNPEVMIECPRIGTNPLCEAEAWWPAENLGIYVRFSIRDLPKWRANIEAARMLVMRWRENALK